MESEPNIRNKLSRGKGIAALALVVMTLAITAALLFYVYQLGFGSGKKQAEANGYAAEYPADTVQRINDCWTQPDRADAQECVTDAITASHESQRSEYDLQAQREMSDWAFWLLVLSLVQMPIAIIGLVALLETIRQGREANGIARETAKGQLRAYIGIASQGIEPSKIDGLGKVVFTLKNYGQTPAIRQSTRISIGVGPYDDETKALPAKWDRISERPKIDIVPQGEPYREIKLPEQTIMHMDAIKDGTSAIFIEIRVAYRDIFNRRHEQTTIYYARRKRYQTGQLNLASQGPEITTPN